MSDMIIPAQAAGIHYGVPPNIASDWLAAQSDLKIVLKDGYTFFQHN